MIDGKMIDIPEFKSEMTWLTYEQVGKRVRDVAAGLVEFTTLNSGDKLAIYENTCREWQITAQACLRYGITIVTVFASLGQEAIITSLNETQITAIMMGEDLLPNLKEIANGVPSLKYVIFNPSKIYPYSFDTGSLPQNLKVISFEEVEKMGLLLKEAPKIKNVPRENDLALIMYTSGTTGEPKGVMHAHSNLITMLGRHEEEITPAFPLDTKKMVHLAYLP
jgi:long-chain acyl-CoA synthetase